MIRSPHTFIFQSKFIRFEQSYANKIQSKLLSWLIFFFSFSFFLFVSKQINTMEFCSRLVIICAICWATFCYRLLWRWRPGTQFLRGKSTKKSFVYWKMRNGLQQFRNARLFPFQAISPSVCSPTFYPISSSVFKYLQSYCPLEPDMNYDGYNSYSWCTLHIHETSICIMMCTGENDASHVCEWGANCRPLGITAD